MIEKGMSLDDVKAQTKAHLKVGADVDNIYRSLKAPKKQKAGSKTTGLDDDSIEYTGMDDL